MFIAVYYNQNVKLNIVCPVAVSEKFYLIRNIIVAIKIIRLIIVLLIITLNLLSIVISYINNYYYIVYKLKLLKFQLN